jgi:DNA polymerase-3 subunit gamma/tau
VTTALYRRYRPETFADVIGQEHVTEPLMRALATGRVGHAYLFSGPRGCGKTTSARILARCLNCEQGPTAEPCGVCDSCVALARGGAGTVDVIEIDAASHGGVDDARDLRERASYGPAASRYKVYIIDEAHMVTPQGFNALLKIVEEPPEHVKFVFATTEPEKVIGTIRSRTHHYPFRLVPPQRLQDYLAEIAEQEGVAVAPGVLSFVVRAGGGSVRDSLSVLDQLIAGSGPEGLTYESAAALLGFTDGELLDAAIDAFAAADAAGAFRAVERVVESGIDPRRFVEDLLERLRDLIVVAAVPDGGAAVLRNLPADQLERMRVQAAAFGAGALSRAADLVNAGLTEMTGATSPRLQLELIAARILLPAASGESGYAARLDRLERRLEVGGVPTPAGRPSGATTAVDAAGPVGAVPAAGAAGAAPPLREAAVVVETSVEVTPSAPAGAAPATPGAPAAAEAPAAAGVEVRTTAATVLRDGPVRASAAADPVARRGGGAPHPGVAPTPASLDTAAIRRSWPDVLSKVYELRRTTWTFVSEHTQVIDFDGERLLLGIQTSGLATTFRRGPHAEYVRQALIDVLGVDTRVEGVPAEGATAGAAASAATTADAAGPPSVASPSEVAPSVVSPSAAPPPAPAAAARQAAPPPAAPAPDPIRAAPPSAPTPSGTATPAGARGAAAAVAEHASWADAPTDPTTRPSWGGPPEEHVADDTAISPDDPDIDELADVGVPVVERLLGATVIAEEET